jgi:predicted RNase H-like nuclease (RuvC/YqgF family)
LREHIESLKNLVEVKNQSIEKLEQELQLMKDEAEDSSFSKQSYLQEIKLEKQGGSFNL